MPPAVRAELRLEASGAEGSSVEALTLETAAYLRPIETGDPAGIDSLLLRRATGLEDIVNPTQRLSRGSAVETSILPEPAGGVARVEEHWVPKALRKILEKIRALGQYFLDLQRPQEAGLVVEHSDFGGGSLLRGLFGAAWAKVKAKVNEIRARRAQESGSSIAEELSHADPDVRLGAARRLLGLAPEEAKIDPQLLDTLIVRETDPQITQALLIVGGRTQNLELIPTFQRVLVGDSDPMLRETALNQLCSFLGSASLHPRFREEIVASLTRASREDTKPELRWKAMVALEGMGRGLHLTAGLGGQDLLLEIAGSQGANRRLEALGKLYKLWNFSLLIPRPQEIAQVLALLKDRDSRVQHLAVRILVVSRSSVPEAALRELAQSDPTSSLGIYARIGALSIQRLYGKDAETKAIAERELKAIAGNPVKYPFEVRDLAKVAMLLSPVLESLTP